MNFDRTSFFAAVVVAVASVVSAALAFSADAPPLHTYICIYMCVIPHVIHIYIYIYLCNAFCSLTLEI